MNATTASRKQLEAIGIQKGDAEAILEIAARLQISNTDAWNDASYWLAVTDGDGAPHFVLADTEDGGNARPRYVSEFEKRQITALRWVLRRYPRLCACMRPSPEDAAIIITSADPELDELRDGFIIVRAHTEIPQLPEDDDILG